MPSSSWPRIFELVLAGRRGRTIGERFFGTASLTILLVTISAPGSVRFTHKLVCALAAQIVTAALAVVLMKLERKAAR